MDLIAEIVNVAELFARNHGEGFSAAQIRIEALQDSAELAKSLRKRVGFDSTTVTLSDARQTQGRRAKEMRKALRRL